MSTPIKHPGIGRSSSQGEVRLLPLVNPIEPTFSMQEKTRPTIKKPRITIGRSYPPQNRVPTFELQPLEPVDKSSINKKCQDGEFLTACSLCKKKFDENGDIFMYGDMGCFCSPKCRTDQILLDGFFKIEDSKGFGNRGNQNQVKFK